MIKWITALWILILIPTALAAQYRENFLVTKQNDTIRGDVRISHAFFRSPTAKVKGYNGRQYTFQLREVQAYRKHSELIYVDLYQKRNGSEGFKRYQILEDGLIKLAKEPSNTPYDPDRNLHEKERMYVAIEGVFYLIDKKNMIQYIWPALTKCERFADLHGDYSQQRVGRLGAMGQHYLIRQMIRKHNELCHQ